MTSATARLHQVPSGPSSGARVFGVHVERRTQPAALLAPHDEPALTEEVSHAA
jgi:hypothetical protein